MVERITARPIDQLYLRVCKSGAIVLVFFARVQQRIGISFTAREIGELGSMPVNARGALRRIIHSVEVSVFGGSDIGAEDYRFARSDYSEFAFGETTK